MEGTTGGVLGQPWEDPRRRWRGGRGSSLGICPGERQRAPLPIRRHCASPYRTPPSPRTDPLQEKSTLTCLYCRFCVATSIYHLIVKGKTAGDSPLAERLSSRWYVIRTMFRLKEIRLTRQGGHGQGKAADKEPCDEGPSSSVESRSTSG